VCARKNRDADGVRIFLNRGLDNLLRSLVKSGVDDFHPRVTQGACDDLGPPVVAVETGLSDDHTDFLRH
jgi:hypothetical protein